MILSKTIAVTMLLLAHRATADPVPTVSTVIDGKDGFWVGQRVVLQVELEVPGYFSGVPMFDTPDVAGALIIPPTGSPMLSSEEKDGVGYTKQLYGFTVFPKRAGKMEVPAFEIRVGFKRNPLETEAAQATVKTESVSFTAKLPPGSRATADPLTSADLTVTETWKPEPGADSKPGDAFVRTIVWSASDVPGMAFPPLQQERVAGLGIYLGEPVVEDTSNRGTLHGSRTDRVTYVCKTGGDFLIPEKIVRWWDPEKNAMQEVTFPAHHLHVVAPPVPPESAGVRIDKWLRHYGWTAAAWLLALVLVGAAFWRLRQDIARFAKRFLPRHLEPLNPGLPPRPDLG